METPTKFITLVGLNNMELKGMKEKCSCLYILISGGIFSINRVDARKLFQVRGI